jgi:hypothetical protein
MKKLLLAASCFMIEIASPVSPATAAYEDWYLDCTIVEKSIPDWKIIGYYDQLFKDTKAVKIHMQFDNGGNLAVEDVKMIKYITNETSDDDFQTPVTLFDTVRFDGGKQLVAGVVTWCGSEPRSNRKTAVWYNVHGWSMTGEVKKVQGAAYDATYTETFFRKNRIIGRMLSTCVFNNPN